MQFELDLLENSYDYLNETLRYYKDLGYNETHDPDRDSIDEKKKWKTTFILLVQAVELLIKEKLFRINPVLIYEDIDAKNNDNSKVIGYSKSIERLSNFNSNLIPESDIQFLKSCGNIRNQCIHYKVSLNSIEIKKKYCKLFQVYLKLHRLCFRKKYANESYKSQIDNILKNAKDLVVFRGNEYNSKMLVWYKNELKKGQQFCYGIANKIAYDRVKYGNESKVDLQFYGEVFVNNECRYCGDCAATYGEYHALGCDCELCPKCGKQIVSCECFDGYYDISVFEEQEIISVVSFNK